MPNREQIAGIDDATKCPVIGSIFIAGVTANKKIVDYWRTLRVRDSKLIGAPRRKKLERSIKESALAYSVTEITPHQMEDADLNLNDWEMLAVMSLIRRLQRKSDPSMVLIDNWEVSARRFHDRLDEFMRHGTLKRKGVNISPRKLKGLDIIPEHRADENHVIVGAASILAKQASDRQYARYRKMYGNFGSGSPADPTTRRFVFNHRHDPPPIVRKAWRTYKVLSSLDDLADDPVRKKLGWKSAT